MVNCSASLFALRRMCMYVVPLFLRFFSLLFIFFTVCTLKRKKKQYVWDRIHRSVIWYHPPIILCLCAIWCSHFWTQPSSYLLCASFSFFSSSSTPPTMVSNTRMTYVYVTICLTLTLSPHLFLFLSSFYICYLTAVRNKMKWKYEITSINSCFYITNKQIHAFKYYLSLLHMIHRIYNILFQTATKVGNIKCHLKLVINRGSVLI